MKNLLTLLVLFSSSFSYGQLFKKDSTHLKYSAGFYNNLYYFNAIADDQTKEKVNIFSAEIKPYVTYYFYKNLGLGALFSYEFYSSNFYNKKSYKEFGFYLDYVLPYTIDKPFLRKIHFFTNPGYFFTNYLILEDTIRTITYKKVIIEENYIIGNKFDQSMICLPVGIKFNVWNGLNINVKWQYLIYLNEGSDKNGFTLGISYDVKRRK